MSKLIAVQAHPDADPQPQQLAQKSRVQQHAGRLLLEAAQRMGEDGVIDVLQML